MLKGFGSTQEYMDEFPMDAYSLHKRRGLESYQAHLRDKSAHRLQTPVIIQPQPQPQSQPESSVVAPHSKKQDRKERLVNFGHQEANSKPKAPTVHQSVAYTPGFQKQTKQQAPTFAAQVTQAAFVPVIVTGLSRNYKL